MVLTETLIKRKHYYVYAFTYSSCTMPINQQVLKRVDSRLTLWFCNTFILTINPINKKKKLYSTL